MTGLLVAVAVLTGLTYLLLRRARTAPPPRRPVPYSRERELIAWQTDYRLALTVIRPESLVRAAVW